MKIFGRIVILLFAWVLLVGAVYPVRYTPWADNVRTMVQEARARRRAQMQNSQQPNQHQNRGEKAVSDGSEKPAKASAPPSGPKAKPANVCWASVRQIWKFALYTLIPCFVTIIFVAIGRHWKTSSTTEPQ